MNRRGMSPGNKDKIRSITKSSYRGFVLAAALLSYGCASPEKPILAEPENSPEPAQQNPVQQQRTTRLVPPTPAAALPTVSNELIVADTVIDQATTGNTGQSSSSPAAIELNSDQQAIAENTSIASAAAPMLENNSPQFRSNPNLSSKTDKPDARAFDGLIASAESGDSDAQYAVGNAFATGTGVEKDSAIAHKWYQLSAEQGNDRSQYKLGAQYFNGAGVAKSYAMAREWWLEAATQGNANAQQKLGYLYSEALGVERNYERAISWYKRAGHSGHAEAQTLLGSLYHEGNRIPQNYAEAFKWYKRAALSGHPHAQYTLATLYHDGYGTEQSYVKCTAWVDVALANGYSDDFNARDECVKHLDETSLNKAAQLATRWKTIYLERSEYN